MCVEDLRKLQGEGLVSDGCVAISNHEGLINFFLNPSTLNAKSVEGGLEVNVTAAAFCMRFDCRNKCGAFGLNSVRLAKATAYL